MSRVIMGHDDDMVRGAMRRLETALRSHGVHARVVQVHDRQAADQDARAVAHRVAVALEADDDLNPTAHTQVYEHAAEALAMVYTGENQRAIDAALTRRLHALMAE